MDGAGVQSKANRGYAIAAYRAGDPYKLYRATSATNPTDPANVVDAFPVLRSSARGGPFTKPPNAAGLTEWFGYFDQSTSQSGDYLIAVADGKTHLIGAFAPFTVAQLFECERVVSVLRGQDQSVGGRASSYMGTTVSNEKTLMSGYPAAMAPGGRGDRSPTGLPSDTYMTGWICHLAAFAGVTIEADDYLTDDLDRRFSVSAAHLQGGFWRLVLALDRG